MRVVLVSFVARGAADQYISETANALVGSNQVHVLIPNYTKDSYFDPHVQLDKLDISINLITAFVQLINPIFMLSFFKKIDGLKADIVHIIFEQRFMFLYAYLLRRKFPVVLTIHEPNNVPNKGMIGNLLSSIFQNINNRELVNNADRVIVHSEKMKNSRLFKNVEDKKIKVVPIGPFSIYKSYRSDIKESWPNILFFGKVAPYKGLRYLIKAAKLVKKELPDLTVTISGEGNLAKYKKLLENSDYFLINNKYISDSNVAEIFEKASVVVLPYTSGSQTGVISIAGTFKKPIIVTDVGNFAEMVGEGETGIVVPPGDVERLARAIIKLLKDDKLRQKMGDNAFIKINEEFSWKRIADRLCEIYEETIREVRNT